LETVRVTVLDELFRVFAGDVRTLASTLFILVENESATTVQAE